jgi:hypothetical protein
MIPVFHWFLNLRCLFDAFYFFESWSPQTQQELTSFIMITPVEFSLSSYWHIALAIDQEKPHGKPNQHHTMFTLHEVQARIASQWRLVTIFTIITIILHFLNWPTIGAYADGSHLHNQQQPSSPNLKTECKTNPYKRRLDFCLQHKFRGANFGGILFLWEKGIFSGKGPTQRCLVFLIQSPQNACAHFHVQTWNYQTLEGKTSLTTIFLATPKS